MIIVLAGCAPQAPAPDSGSGLAYGVGQTIPIDTKIYHVDGIVSSGTESLTRQVSPAGGTMRSYDGYGYGSFWGPTVASKGFVRIKVTKSDSLLAVVGDTAVLKVEDTKAIVLTDGDKVSFKCRAQFESLSAITNSETLSEDGGVWELDYCRMTTPIVKN